MPVDGQAWDTDPFTVTEKQGRLYGRGTCDMKGFDAIALAAVPLALERGLKRPLQIALSYDEEVGCAGAPPMIVLTFPANPCSPTSSTTDSITGMVVVSRADMPMTVAPF